jgi:hypothetical protein
MDHVEFSARGGNARAKKLSKARRQQIAQDAVRVRWQRFKDTKRTRPKR